MVIITLRASQLPMMMFLLILVLLIYEGMPSNSSYGITNGSDNNHDGPKHISKLLSSAQRVTVLVVGGGVSGLSTVETLVNNGVDNVLLLEATGRLGGRLKTIRQDGILVEEGCEWIHGDDRNPVYNLANELDAVGKNVPEEEWEWMQFIRRSNDYHGYEETSNWELLYQLIADAEKDDVLVPYFHSSYGQFFIDKFQKVFGDNANSSEGRALLHALEQGVNLYEGTNNWMDIAPRQIDAWVSYGEDHNWKDGYDTLITHLLSKIPSSKIQLSNPVSEVYWDQDSLDGVLVGTVNGSSFIAQHVVFTASVEYLKKNHHNIFSPPLPKPYIKSLEGINLGVVDKIQIGWDAPWWSNTSAPFTVSILWEIRDLPKEMSWLYGVAQIWTVYQQPTVLQIFINGDNAKTMESLTEDQVKLHVMYLLGRIIKESVPPPTFFHRSQWGLNPWTLGSYSSLITLAGDKEGLHSRKPLAKSLYNSRGKMVLCWAGEHTHDTRFSTVDGARESGIREATNILKLINPNEDARAAAMALSTVSEIAVFIIVGFVAVFVV